MVVNVFCVLYNINCFLKFNIQISLSKTMSCIFSSVGLSTTFNLTGAIYCAIVAVIIGHLHFFLVKESSDNKPTLEQAVQIYLESASNNAVNLQTVENLFKASLVDDASLKNFKHSQVNKELLARGAIQIALDNLLWKYWTDVSFMS